MKPQIQGDIQPLPLGPQIVTAIQGRPVVTNTPPVGSSYIWSGSAWVPGGRIAYGTNTSAVSTAGTTFAGGADLLATPLKFTATGSNSYIVRVSAQQWGNSGAAGTGSQLRINLDGADAGLFANMQVQVAGDSAEILNATAYLATPSAGAHTVNVRLVVGGTGTASVASGAGGAGATLPILVTLEIA